jgi:hypothetical protein
MPERVNMDGMEGSGMKVFRDYALGWVLLSLFVLFWVGQTLVGWQEFLAEQSEHGQVAQVFGDGGYVWNWARTTLENWQSEMLQLFAMVVLTSFLIFKGSPESKDGDDEMKETLARLERRLEELAASRTVVDGGIVQTRRIWSVTARNSHDDCHPRRRSAGGCSADTGSGARRPYRVLAQIADESLCPSRAHGH